MAKLRMSATDCCKILRNGRIFAHLIERRYIVDGTVRDPMHEQAAFKIRQVLLTYVRREIDARMTRRDYYCGGPHIMTEPPKTRLEFCFVSRNQVLSNFGCRAKARQCEASCHPRRDLRGTDTGSLPASSHGPDPGCGQFRPGLVRAGILFGAPPMAGFSNLCRRPRGGSCGRVVPVPSSPGVAPSHHEMGSFSHDRVRTIRI